MHILHFTLGFLPADSWGGPVKIVYRNAKELVRRGHEVTVYCTNLLDKNHKIEPRTFADVIDGIRVVYFNTWNLSWWPGTLGPIWLPDMQDYLRREMRSFDVVHLNGYRLPAMIPIVKAAREAGIPVVTQPHGAMQLIMNSIAVKKMYDKYLGARELAGISAVIAGQETERAQVQAYGVPDDRIVIIRNGINIDEIGGLPPNGAFRRRYGLPSDKPIVLFMHRINRKKGTDMLVEAFARLAGNTDAFLVIAGPDDGQLGEVLDLIQRHELEDRVALTGLLQGDDIKAALHDAEIFVLPCRTDTFPMAIVEACALSLPMVITDRCEIAHLVQDRVADVTPFDAAAFAAAMQRLLTDRERYARYQANCPVVMADTFSIQAVGDQLESLYERVVAERKCNASSH